MTQRVRPETIKTTVAYVDAVNEDLVPIFLKNQLEGVESIVEACEQSDYEKIHSLGRDMKGTGSAYGTQREGRRCGRIIL